MNLQISHHLSLRLKATLVVLTVTLIALSIVTVSSVIQMRRTIAAEESSEVQAIAQGVGHASELAMAVGDKRELARVAGDFLPNAEIIFIAMYDNSGRLLVHRGRDANAWAAYQRRSGSGSDFFLGEQPVEVAAANANEFDIDQPEASGSTKSAPPSRGGDAKNKVGRVVVALSTAPGLLAQREQGRITAASTALAAVVSVIVTFVSVTRWGRRLDRLVSASDRISHGDFEQAIQDLRHDEIGRLSHAFERMREAVRQRDGELRHFNETLQQQVEERTRSLSDALEAAKAADKAKSHFLAAMSHEIRTPLNGVVGMIDLLRGTQLDESQQRFTLVARTSAESLLTVINDILDFSKIEAGRMDMEATDFDVAEVVENIAETASIAASRKGLEVSSFIQPAMPSLVVGDPIRFGQILSNLVNNAIKFTEVGQVVVRASLESEDKSHVSIKVSVTDSGIGIPADRRNRLFQSFSQIDASTSRKYGGTGLGLAISKRLAEMMGGTIGVESEPGRGSTFWFTAHLAKSQNDRSAQSAKQAFSKLKNLRIIAVDDNAVNLEILQQQLAAWNLEVHTAGDGPTALEMLRSARSKNQPFDVALLDWHMPTMDGIEVAKAIRAAKEIEDTTLIMLTSVEDHVEARKMKDLGFSGYLVKPVRQSRLLNTITDAVCGPRLVTAPSEEKAMAKGAKPRSIRSHAHILLAEDNEINRVVASEILKDAGYVLDMVNGGAAAVAAVAAKKYDVVLMDCQMPGMDGFEATREIRAREDADAIKSGQKRHVTIIALTANAIKGDRELCLSAGMDEYLTKPIDAELLLALLDRCLTASAAQPATLSQPQNGEENSPPIDFQSLLKRCLGKTNVAGTVLDLFEGQAEEQFRKLQQSIAQQQFDAVAGLAHALKGTAANVSADSVFRAASELEQLAQRRDLEDADAKLRQLKAEVDRCIAYIRHRKSNAQTDAATTPPKAADTGAVA